MRHWVLFHLHINFCLHERLWKVAGAALVLFFICGFFFLFLTPIGSFTRSNVCYKEQESLAEMKNKKFQVEQTNCWWTALVFATYSMQMFNSGRIRAGARNIEMENMWVRRTFLHI